MTTHTGAASAARPTTPDEVRHLGVVPLHHSTKPSAAGVLGISRNLAYRLASRGDIPVIRLGRKLVVPVPALMEMLGERESVG